MQTNRFHELKADLMSLWILATVALCLGLLVNRFRDVPLPLIYQTKEQRLDHAVSVISSQQSGIPSKTNGTSATSYETLPESLTLEQFHAYVSDKKVLILDARPELFHRIGHVPGATPLPRDDFENYYHKLQSVLEKDKKQPLVIYCSGVSCEDSSLTAETLKKLGYTNIAIFHGGWDEWIHAGLPKEKTP